MWLEIIVINMQYFLIYLFIYLELCLDIKWAMQIILSIARKWHQSIMKGPVNMSAEYYGTTCCRKFAIRFQNTPGKRPPFFQQNTS